MNQIVVPGSAVAESVLRITLRRIPEVGGHILLRRLGATGKVGELVGETWLYGRGVGSVAKEQTVLRFILRSTAGGVPVVAGDALILVSEENEQEQPLSLDIINVE